MANHDDFWEASTEDFGQKVDLTVRIREILRNYPEGLSILKELLQNADDAGARTVRLCTAEPRLSNDSKSSSPLSNLMSSPSLLAYNSAKFTAVDFQSIQRIGDSLKKTKTGTKTGRFGVGVNSTYHLTEVPMFVSGTKVVLFDPQAKFVPGINPANPGKMIDCSTEKGKQLVTSLPDVFNSLRVWGNTLNEEEFDGTIFRFALRSEEQAQVSRLSNQSHSLQAMTQLLKEMSCSASTMLLFLKNVENIEIYNWKSEDEEPILIHQTKITNNSERLQKKRSFMLNANPNPEIPVSIDYFLDIESNGMGTTEMGGKLSPKEKWVVCNQLGGGNASKMAQDPRLAHMKLIPWAGVAGRLDPIGSVDDGIAYCFLPLPVKTKLPVHVNGYFELSSNRRDVWWGDDMAGDGRARAEWNRSLVSDIAAPCYCRLLLGSIKSKQLSPDTYETLFPQKTVSGPWEVLSKNFFMGIRKFPVLYSKSLEWVSPSISILMEDEENHLLAEILLKEKVPLVLLQSSELRKVLLERSVCLHTSSPKFIRNHFSNRTIRNGALEDDELKLAYAEHILKHCISDLNPSQYHKLSQCQLVPLGDGNLGTFCQLPKINQTHLRQLKEMGYTKLNCEHALRRAKNNIDAAIEFLFGNTYDSSIVIHGIDPYLVCGGDEAKLMERASNTFINIDLVSDTVLKNFFKSKELKNILNINIFTVDFIADLVSRVIPAEWRNVDSAIWDTSDGSSHPNHEWFQRFWRYLILNIGDSLDLIAEKNCIVPTNQGVVCNLSPGSSVVDANNLDENIEKAIIPLHVKTFLANTLPSDLVIPKPVWSYIHKGNREGIINSVEAAIRREINLSTSDAVSPFIQMPDETKQLLYNFLINDRNGPISKTCSESLKLFPIFQNHSEDESTSKNFISLKSSTSWFMLKTYSTRDEPLLSSEFITFNKKDLSEIQLLSSLDVRSVTKVEFYRLFIIPRITEFDEKKRQRVVENILLDLPSLSEAEPEFLNFMREVEFIPSATTKSLSAAKNLYDPETSELRALMETDAFPHNSLWTPAYLVGLRKLGLQNSLTWDVVIECAKSIQDEDELDAGISIPAQRRGRELLNFLDTNWRTFFPELAPKEKSTAKKLFSKMSSVLFEDPDKKRLADDLQKHRIDTLKKLKWIPVHNSPPNQILPWQDVYRNESVAAPLAVVLKENMWYASYSKHLLESDVKSLQLMRLFGWTERVALHDIAIQLRAFGENFQRLKGSLLNESNDNSMTLDTLHETLSAELPRIYNQLNKAQTENEINQLRSILNGRKWLWLGERFVAPDYAAFTSSINASPYLFTIPPDLACFKNLLSIFRVRQTFGSSDYCEVLRRIALDEEKADKRNIEIAVNLVQCLSDDVMKLQQMEIYAPNEDGVFQNASEMVYDDAPWMSKNSQSKDFFFIHPKISNTVAAKIGSKSFRRFLVQDTMDSINFGEGVVHESFGQSESLTRRLKNIVEMYPEGPQQLSELIQNADDAKASIVRLIINKKTYGTKSLIGQKMSAWQGPSLIVYNDSTFSSRDFQNLARIGQASKLEKLVTTGRFGLGFNSVFHWTDVPSFVSGGHLVFFDPHEKYVPGASSTSRGIKIKFKGTNLLHQFPDQFSPYCYFGNDMKNHFDGTIFRFPFRNEMTASESEISNNQSNEAIDNLIEQFKDVLPKFLLFLRHVKKIEVYVEDVDDKNPHLLYYADVMSRKVIKGGGQAHKGLSFKKLDDLKSIASNGVLGLISTEQSADWNSISNFITGSGAQPLSKEAFYSKLLRTPLNHLPKTRHVVEIKFEEFKKLDYTSEEKQLSTIEFPDVKEDEIEISEMSSPVTVKGDTNCIVKTQIDEYLICTALGGGECRQIACKEEYRHLKFLPWGGVAAHLKRDGNHVMELSGNAFCFLPLPAETGLPVHINGYFELSANRRDIWYGNDMVGDGYIRSNWNYALLNDVIAPLYTDLLLSASQLLGPGAYYNRLWPLQVNGDVWKKVLDAVYNSAQNLPLLHSSINGGKWLSPNISFILSESDKATFGSITSYKSYLKKISKLTRILLKENLNLVRIPSKLCNLFTEQNCKHTEVTPSVVRSWFKISNDHPSLANLEDVLFLLKYCIGDIMDDNNFHELVGLPFVPLCNDTLGFFSKKVENSSSTYYVTNELEREILANAKQHFVNIWSNEASINDFFLNKEIQSQMNISRLGAKEFVHLLSYVFPSEWNNLPEVQWSQSCSSSTISTIWMKKLWKYINGTKEGIEIDINLFVDSWQILPTLIGQNGRTIMKLTRNMAVLSPQKSLAGADCIPKNISIILRDIGVRVVDTNLFEESIRSSLLSKLESFIQQPTLCGILRAIMHSLPSNTHEDDLVRRMKLRFKNISNNDKEDLRRFFQNKSSQESSSLEPELVKTIQLMPIFPVHNASIFDPADAPFELMDLVTERFLPPSCADSSLLDHQFAYASERSEVAFLKNLSIRTMTSETFYESYVIPLITREDSSEKSRNMAVMNLLTNVPNVLNEIEDPNSWIERISNLACIPNRAGDLMKPKDLCDPDSNELVNLLDDSMMPRIELIGPRTLAGLQSLGLRSRLNCEGVLESARSIETSSASIVNCLGPAGKIVRKRSLALLQYLDSDDTMRELLNECRRRDQTDLIGEDVEPNEHKFSTSLNSYEGRFIAELKEIAWLPIEMELKGDQTQECHPPKRTAVFKCTASPIFSRPKSEEWLCSFSMEILSISVRSNYLLYFFGWNKNLPIIVIASQLLALSQLWNENENNSYRQMLATILAITVPRCYEILNNHMDTASIDDKEKLVIALQEKPWVWVGDQFVGTSQVAFDAPENARPYLFSIPPESLCFETLFKCCGVRDIFDPEDYVKLTNDLNTKLQGNIATSKQIDLAIAMAKLLYRLPTEELILVNLSSLYLPSKEKKMYRAKDMIFDDAPWLSSLVSNHIKRTKHYVHEDISNDVAKILGAKSLRDVLSGSQVGMVNVPCPKLTALKELFAERKTSGSKVKTEDCRILLEVLEFAEMNKVKQVSFMMDYRSHNSESLLSPMLSHAQGPSLIVCLHDVIVDVEKLIKSCSPSRYYMENVSGRGGCGGEGFPRHGRGLASCFFLSDFMQVLFGNQLLMFDPSGEFFFDGNVGSNSKSQNSCDSKQPIARSYGISAEFLDQFPDQFEPFLSLPYGIKESFTSSSHILDSNETSNRPSFRGTIIRLPLRLKDRPNTNTPICSREFDNDAISDLLQELQEKLPSSFLFSYNLQYVRIDEWKISQNKANSLLHSRICSSPITRRSHRDELEKNKDWVKSNSKITQLFKSEWIPIESSFTMQISTRTMADEIDFIDTYYIKSILAPGRLRGMACTEVLKPLKMTPTISLAAHIHRNRTQEKKSTTYAKLSKGSLFVGLDTFIKTGLPLFMNAPIFLHELTGKVLLDKKDDEAFIEKFPATRNIKVPSKQGNGTQVRSVALHIWNREAISSGMTLIPKFLKEIRTDVLLNYYRDPRQLYYFWPFYSNIRQAFNHLVPNTVYQSLADETNQMFLTNSGSFKGINEGYFASLKHPVPTGVADYFHKNLSMFNVPHKVIADLEHFNIKVRCITPKLARQILKKQGRITAQLASKPEILIELLLFCLADIHDESDTLDTNTNSVKKSELNGLHLMPLADGGIGTIGTTMIIATGEQQELLPSKKSKFVSTFAAERLDLFFDEPSFLYLLSLTKFEPKVIADNISSILPLSWEGKDFVPWGSNENSPSQLWLYQFWKEVPIWDSDCVQLFNRWPLIPTKNGELASCRNLQHILSFYLPPDDQMNNNLREEYNLLVKKCEEKRNSECDTIKSQEVTEDEDAITWDDQYINLGISDEISIGSDAKDDKKIDGDDEMPGTSTGDEIPVEQYAEDDTDDTNEIVSQATSPNITASQVSEPDTVLLNENNRHNHYLHTSSMKNLHEVLIKVQCPLLEIAYFNNESLTKLLPSDRLSLSRNILVTFNQCLNYWTTMSLPSSERLQWPSLDSNEMDTLLILIAFDQGQRLSLMPSDFNLLRKLPIYETIAHERVSLESQDEHFFLDPSVDIKSLNTYLPKSLKNKFLLEKEDIKDLLQDLGVKPMTEAKILEEFVIPQFATMPMSQKELLCETIAAKWENLRLSGEFINVLKKTPFVKRTKNDFGGEIEFVEPGTLFDPRNDFLYSMFDGSQNKFPAGEFREDKWLEILAEIGLNNNIDKDVFLQCAWRVETQNDVEKGLKLHNYYAEHFAEFYDSTQEFNRKFSEIKCVPGSIDEESMCLYKFKDVAAPKDTPLVFKVLPVIPDSIAPPQVMFSSLGIQSPPSIQNVLRQIRILTEEGGDLYNWNDKYGTIEEVFGSIFSFLQENYDRLSPVVQSGLSKIDIVPIGTTLVKASKLFFRLSKDLAPFFFEVPRAFGAYDTLLRSFGVRESPQTEDYAVSLFELKRDLGEGKLNANELNSVVEVLHLIADDRSKKGSVNLTLSTVYVPDSNGVLVQLFQLVQNDRPWLLHSKRLNNSFIRVVHPKVSKELCAALDIGKFSERISEHLEDSFELEELPMDSSLLKLQQTIESETFGSVFKRVMDQKKLNNINALKIKPVKLLRTRFLLKSKDRVDMIDVTSNPLGSFCFIKDERIFLSQRNMPKELKAELVISLALCDHFKIDRKNAAGISAMLASDVSNIELIMRALGVGSIFANEELERGEPGRAVKGVDLELLELKPLKIFGKSEIVAIKENMESGTMIYAVIVDGGGGSSLTRLRVRKGKNEEVFLLSSEIYSLRRATKSDHNNKENATKIELGPLGHTGLVTPMQKSEDDQLIRDSDAHSELFRSNGVRPVDQTEVLRAVQDLLKSSNLSLRDDVESVLAQNLKLQEESKHHSAYVESLINEGRGLAKHLAKNMDTFICPITRDLMSDPVICSDGHTYERHAIEEWLRSNSRSPKTNQRLHSRDLIPNHALRGTIEGMKDSMNAMTKFTKTFE